MTILLYSAQNYIRSTWIQLNMSFFDNTKIAGWGLFFIGILMIISAILMIWNGATTEGDDRLANVVVGIGALLAAFIYFGFGNKVRKGEISAKIEVLAQFVKTVGLATIVSAFFAAIAGIWGVGISTWTNVVILIIGIIIVWIGGKINDGKTTNFDKILWIILVVIFLIEFILKVAGAFGGDWINILSCILMAIVYLYMLVFMFDGDVRKKMGM